MCHWRWRRRKGWWVLSLHIFNFFIRSKSIITCWTWKVPVFWWCRLDVSLDIFCSSQIPLYRWIPLCVLTHRTLKSSGGELHGAFLSLIVQKSVRKIKMFDYMAPMDFMDTNDTVWILSSGSGIFLVATSKVQLNQLIAGTLCPPMWEEMTDRSEEQRIKQICVASWHLPLRDEWL